MTQSFLPWAVPTTLISIHMRFPMNTFQGEEISRGRSFQLNVITSLIQIFFFRGDFRSRIFSDFFRTALILEKLLLHASSEQLLRRNSYFFGAAVSSEKLRFLRSSVFLTVTSSQQLFLQNTHYNGSNLLPSSDLLRK